MTEEQAVAVNTQEVGEPEANASNETVQQKQQSSAKEYNFRQIEKQLQEQKQLVKELTDALKTRTPDSRPSEDESLPNLSPDEIPEWRHVSKSLQQSEKRAEKLAEEKIKAILAEQEKSRLPQQVRQKFTDFDEVVTAERIQQLEKDNPALAQAFSLAADPFSATYSYLKAVHGVRKKDPVAQEESEKIAENAKKPMGGAVAGKQGALKNANAFSKKSKEQLYSEMVAAANRAM